MRKRGNLARLEWAEQRGLGLPPAPELATCSAPIVPDALHRTEWRVEGESR